MYFDEFIDWSIQRHCFTKGISITKGAMSGRGMQAQARLSPAAGCVVLRNGVLQGIVVREFGDVLHQPLPVRAAVAHAYDYTRIQVLQIHNTSNSKPARTQG